jgi:hypothetical protein
VLGVGVKLVDQRLFGVDELVYNLHERRDYYGTRLADLLKDLAVPEAFLVAIDDLVVLDANAGVAVLEEPVGVVAKPLSDLHAHPLEVEGVSRAVIGRLEV